VKPPHLAERPTEFLRASCAQVPIGTGKQDSCRYKKNIGRGFLLSVLIKNKCISYKQGEIWPFLLNKILTFHMLSGLYLA
jgi:hypothetical protein